MITEETVADFLLEVLENEQLDELRRRDSPDRERTRVSMQGMLNGLSALLADAPPQTLAALAIAVNKLIEGAGT